MLIGLAVARITNVIGRHAFRWSKIGLLIVLAVGVLTMSSNISPPTNSIIARTDRHRIVARLKPVAPIVTKRVATRSTFARESALRAVERIDRWNPLVEQASRRFRVPALWIRAVMTIESGGRTMLAENMRITSTAGAMGLMQVMPDTWSLMRRQYRLGVDPYDPHDNIFAGAAYLNLLYHQYGYPGLFAAYNDGPGMLEAHRRLGQMLPAETAVYVLNIASILSTGAPRASKSRFGLPGDITDRQPTQYTAYTVVSNPTTPSSKTVDGDDVPDDNNGR